MTDTAWAWANLDDEAVELVQEAERTIGADVVLVYREGAPLSPDWTRRGLAPAPLDGPKLAWLQGLEQRVGAVAVAYQRVV